MNASRSSLAMARAGGLESSRNPRSHPPSLRRTSFRSQRLPSRPVPARPQNISHILDDSRGPSVTVYILESFAEALKDALEAVLARSPSPLSIATRLRPR